MTKPGRPGARKGKKGPLVGTGGKGRKALEGKGPTPKAADRSWHVAGKRKAAQERLEAVRERHGGAKPAPSRTPRGPRRSDETELVTAEPVSVVLSARGWARAAKGHDIDPRALSYKTGDEFRASARGRSNQQAVFLDSTGRTYCVQAHMLPSARGQGEPLSGRIDPPDGATFAGVMIGDPADRWVLASEAGYGFVAKLEELYSRNRAGKAVLNVPEGSGVLIPARRAARAGQGQGQQALWIDCRQGRQRR